MSVKCREIMWLMEDFAPSIYAESWDNPGLNVGDPDADISRIMIALDATEGVIDEAIENGVDMLITHHPLLFHSVKKIRYDDPSTRKIIKAVRNNLNIFAAHTNLDAAKGGTNDRLAEIIDLKDIKVLSKSENEGIGIGRVGTVDGDMTVGMLAVKIKETLELDAVRITGNMSRKVKNVALCTGAGFEFLKDAINAKCDVFVTADVRYHEAQEALENNIVIIDATHYATENIIVPKLVEYISLKLRNRGIYDVEVVEAKYNGQTFVHV